MNQPDTSGFGKAVAIVFLLVWTLASAGMSLVFLGVGPAIPSGFGPGFGAIPWFMSIMPIGFTLLGAMMLIKVAASKSAPVSSDTRVGLERREPPVAAPLPPLPAPPSCPGCG